ncbi:MAG: hypothetical protein HWN67_00170 [Candidatus Helarchaeota archaeon]|nr:hypothetical protein [Candidatus Helarchaeota archaeon]
MVIILIGDKNSGKTENARLIYEYLISEGISVSGIISRSEMNKNMKKSYYAVDLQTGERRLLASKNFMSGGEKFGNFYFFEEGFKFADRTLTQNISSGVKIIDEVGQLEVKKRGFYKTIRFLIENYNGHLILVVRNSNIENVIKLFDLRDYCVVSIKSNIKDIILKKILK